jgi:hypothetical protein
MKQSPPSEAVLAQLLKTNFPTFYGKPEGKRSFWRHSEDGRKILLKLISEKEDMRVWTAVKC